MQTHAAGNQPDRQPWMRAGDTDREHLVQALQRHTAAGRLSLDEFAERAGAAHRARTYGDLAALIADLPRQPQPQPHRRRGVPRGPVVAGLVVAAVLAVLVGAGAVAQAADLAHPMMAGMSAGMPGCH